MYYTRARSGKKIELDRLKVYNVCYSCGREIEIRGFWDKLGIALELYPKDPHYICEQCKTLRAIAQWNE